MGLDRTAIQRALHESSPAFELLLKLAERVPLNHALWRASEAAVLSKIPMERPILDIGCGDGLFASLLFDAPVDVGIDLSISRLGRARESGAYQDLRIADATELPFDDATFATVFSNCVLEHIPDVDAVCREASRVLRPGGLFVFTVPTDRFEEFLFVPTALRAVGLGGLGDRYAAAMNRVFSHFHTEGVDVWRQRLSAAGLELAADWEIMPRPLEALWDILMPFAAIQLAVRRVAPEWTWPGARRALSLAREPLTYLMAPRGQPGGNLAVVARKPATE